MNIRDYAINYSWAVSSKPVASEIYLLKGESR